MYVLHVTPLTRRFGTETLTYFSAKDMPAGALITIPLGAKEVSALVLSSESGAQAKTKVRTAAFKLKKISAQKEVPLLSPAFVRACEETADYFAAPVGAVLARATPKVLLENSAVVARAKREGANTKKGNAGESAVSNERLVLGTPTADRFTTYKSLIREEFARGRSVFLCVPTIAHAARAEEQLAKGIEEYVFVFHGSLSKKESAAHLAALCKTKHPVLIIALGSFLALPRHDIGSFIIEKENIGGYKTMTRPFIDFRTLASTLARQCGARSIMADFPLRVETIYRYRSGEYDELSPLKLRTTHTSYTIIDVRAKQREKGEQPETAARTPRRKAFRALSDTLSLSITDALASRGRVFLFAARRGLFPLTVCDDCGTALSCEHCGAVVVLYAQEKGNVFLCHTCGLAHRAATLCRTCRSWKLVPLGIGIHRVAEELQKQFPNAPLSVIDKDTTKTPVQARRAAERFYRSEGSILLGTEMALPYLDTQKYEPLAASGVVSLDSLLLLPLWNLSERLLSILVRMREVTEGPLLIQTRHPDYPLFTHLMKGALIDVYRDEIKEREEFGYPPFNVLITFTTTGSLSFVQAEMTKLKDYFKGYALHPYAPALGIGKKTYKMVGLLKVPSGEWPHAELLARIRRLPLTVSVVVNPENTL